MDFIFHITKLVNHQSILPLKLRLPLCILLCGVFIGCNQDDDTEPQSIIINGLEYGVDFTDQVVYESEFRVYSQTNLSNDNITVKNFSLPDNTLFWSYWFIVKQGDQDPFAYAVRELSSQISKYTTNPVTALGLGLISNLPFLQENTETLDFYLTDFENSQLAVDREVFEAYNFGIEENAISVSKAVEKVPDEMIYLVSYNDNFTKGLDAYFMVVAFVKL